MKQRQQEQKTKDVTFTRMEHHSQCEMVEGSICGCCYDESLVSAKKSKSTLKSQIKLNNCYCIPSIKKNCSVAANSSK